MMKKSIMFKQGETILDIGNSNYFYVAHLRKRKIPVEEGQTVQKGVILGYIGNSGNTFFPHLNIHVQNKPKACLERTS